jgi:hypothetical protein
METEAPCYAWRRTSGAAPDAVKVARPVLNGGDEETGLSRPRLVATQLECGKSHARCWSASLKRSAMLRKRIKSS